MTRKLKAGIVGAGFIGLAHIEAIRRLGFVEVAAIAVRDRKRGEEKAREWGVERVYEDYRELLLDPDIDVVHNCTPNHLHFDINKEAIEAGKHILSEKPLAVSSDQTGELLALARKSGVVHGVNFNYRQFPIMRQLSHMIGEGELGAVHLAHGSYLQDWLAKESDYNWRMDPELGGRLRAVADIGSHWCDTVEHVAGQKIASVCADLATVYPVRKRPREQTNSFGNAAEDAECEDVRINTEDYASVLLRFEDGARGVFTVSQVSPGRKNRLSFELNGSRKSASWNQEEPEKLWIGYRDKPNEMLLADPALFAPETRSSIHHPGGHNEGWPDALKHMMLRFYEQVRDSGSTGCAKPDFATFEDGHRSVLIGEAILRSHEAGGWAAIPR